MRGGIGRGGSLKERDGAQKCDAYVLTLILRLFKKGIKQGCHTSLFGRDNPVILLTVLGKHDLSRKKVLLFSSSVSSDFKKV